VQLQVDFLRTLAPGDNISIPLHVLPIPATGFPGLIDDGPGTLLRVVRLNSGNEHEALIYPLTEPGLYTLRFRYRYTGPDDGTPNVFRNEVFSNTIRFRLR
jgi:hypothetical protein